MYVCKYCSREFIKCNSLYAHMSHCKQNPNKTRTYEKEMQYYIDYTIKKYGKDYIKLYEHK